MQVQPYLFFDGRCEEAIEFYRRALRAEVTMLMRFKDSPQPPSAEQCAPGSENKVMHASFRVGDTLLGEIAPEEIEEIDGAPLEQEIPLGIELLEDAVSERATVGIDVREIDLPHLERERDDVAVGKDGDAVFATFAIAHDDLPTRELQILHAQSHAFQNA